MLSTLLAIGWEPEIRGAIVVMIGFGTLMGSVYLLLGTNVGARLGFLLALAGFFGWMFTMGAIWWAYGIGLKGREPSWKPAEPITIIRDAKYFTDAKLVDSISIEESAPADDQAAAAEAALEAASWEKLPESDPGRGQAIASADDIVQNKAQELGAGEYQAVAVYTRGGDRYPKINDTLDFVAFFHEPHYAIVEIALIKPQLSEPGRAPATPVIDSAKPHRYVVMLRDLGSRRQPAMFITLGSGMIFGVLCLMLHRRDRVAAVNRGAVPAKA
jgi:hypothetical protein